MIGTLRIDGVSPRPPDTLVKNYTPGCQMLDKLSDDLRVLLDFELSHDNEICEVIESPADSGPPLFISLMKPFRYRGSLEKPKLATTVEWEVIHDPHYPREWGVTCQSSISRHVIAALTQ